MGLVLPNFSFFLENGLASPKFVTFFGRTKAHTPTKKKVGKRKKKLANQKKSWQKKKKVGKRKSKAI